jgi:glutamine amidotransferase
MSVCRHLAYLGPPVPLATVLFEQPHSLYRQSWAPRRQLHGTVNADGFGVGWYVPGDPQPARYRRDKPIWGDANLPDLARVVRSGAVLAAVRSGTTGMGFAESAAAPFAGHGVLFSHNGAVSGWPGSLAGVAAALDAETLLTLEAPTDSAVLWALAESRLEAGDSLADALSAAVVSVAAAVPDEDARLNLLATDGTQIIATTWGDTLSWREDAGAVVVASEPTDDRPGWHDVPDRMLLHATMHATGVQVTLTALPAPIGAPR